jgi:prepilin-type N-terminal cleavage/methylation domain-containing protein
MPISSAGNRRNRAAGITLIEMLVVATLIGILAAISFPSISAGLDGLRLSSASDSIVSFLNAGLNRAERRQQVVEITILRAERALSMRSTEPGFSRRIEMPEGIAIVGVHPDIPVEADVPRHFLLYPGGAIPRIGIEIANKRNEHRIVRVDPITGVPQVERVDAL